MLEKACDVYRAQLKNSPRAIDYLKGRGLTGRDRRAFRHRLRARRLAAAWRACFPSYDDPLLAESGLVIASEDDGKRYDRFRDRIMFPIRDARASASASAAACWATASPST